MGLVFILAFHFHFILFASCLFSDLLPEKKLFDVDIINDDGDITVVVRAGGQ